MSTSSRELRRRRFGDDEVMPPNGGQAMSNTLRPRPVALPRADALMDETVPVPTLAERYTANAQPLEPTVVPVPTLRPRPRQVEGMPEAPVPTLRPRRIEGMPDVEALPAEESQRQTPSEVRDLRIAEIEGHSDVRPTRWWERAAYGAFQGLQRVNEMANATRDPRTGQTTMDGWQALALAGGEAAMGVASPKGVARQLNQRELATLRGEQAQEQEKQIATLKMRGLQADINYKTAQAEYARQRPALESARTSKPVFKKQGGRIYAVNPQTGEATAIVGRNGEALQPDNQRPVYIDSLAEDGVTVNRLQYDTETQTYKLVMVDGKPVVTKKVEAVTPKGVKAGTAATIESRESEGAANRQARRDEGAANRAARNDGGMSAARRRALELESAKLEADAQDAERDGRPSEATKFRDKKRAVDAQLSGGQASSGQGQTWFGGMKGTAAGASGAARQGQFAGQRAPRSRIPEFARTWGVSEKEAEERLVRGGATLY